MQKIVLRCPDKGFLVIEEKGAQNEYPGVFIYFIEEVDGLIPADDSNIIACVEYDTSNKDGRLLVESYSRDNDEPSMVHSIPRNMIGEKPVRIA